MVINFRGNEVVETLWVRGFLWALSIWLKLVVHAHSAAATARDLTWYCSSSPARVPAQRRSGPNM